MKYVSLFSGIEAASVAWGPRCWECGSELADLIEPSEPKVKCVAEVKVDGERLEKLVHDAAVELTGIDREALLALADELQHHADNAAGHSAYAARFDLAGWSEVIREACGERMDDGK